MGIFEKKSPCMSRKPWQEQPLRFPKKAIIVMDNQASRAALCAGLIIQTFSCQAARAANERDFIRILREAQREECEIVGIITDDGMEIRGSDLIDAFDGGHYSQYYQKPKDPDASTTAYLIITGDQDLNYKGEAGIRKTLVFHLGAWKTFINDPSGLAVGILICSWLGINGMSSVRRQA